MFLNYVHFLSSHTQAASCIDASSGFAGNLTITHSTFGDNGLAISPLSAVNVPPVAVNCSGGTSSVSCNITVEDTLFHSNRGEEALGMGLICLTSQPQTCSFDVTRSNFTQHQLFGTGVSYVMPYSTTLVPAVYTVVGTTAAALVVKANSSSAFTLSVDSCNFMDNQGAGVWVVQGRPDVYPSSVLGEVLISNSSFIGHTPLPGGMPALSVFGARYVSLSDTLWQGNGMGAVALELVQDTLLVHRVVMIDNIAHNTTAATFDIYMMDSAPSNIDVTGSRFVNNTGFTFIPNGTNTYVGAGSVNVASHNSGGGIVISVAATSFLTNYGKLSPGALSVILASEVSFSDVLASSNVGGAAFFYNVTTLLISDSTFNTNQGVTGALSSGLTIPLTPGGGAITAYSPTGTSGQSVQIKNCTFYNNTALSSGAALYSFGASVVNVQKCHFTSNLALTKTGGAININQMSHPSIFSIDDCQLEFCSAAAAGGAVFASGPIDILRISNSYFSKNVAGVLAASEGWGLPDPFGFAANLLDYQFYGAVHGGGALFLTGVALLSIQDSQFYGNAAPHSLGGALRLRFSRASFLQNCSFASNSALSGESTLALELHPFPSQHVSFKAYHELSVTRL